MNVVVIAGKQNGLVKHIPYMELHGYKVHWITEIETAKSVLVTAKPDLILLSWDIPGTNISEAYSDFEQRLGVPCIVFSEDSSTRSLSSLARSRIPEVLLPPLSGPSIHRRIQLFVREKTPQNGYAAEVTDLKKRVEKLLKDSISQILRAAGGPSEKLRPNIIAVTFPSKKLNGYLVVGQDRVELDGGVLKAVYTLLLNKLPQDGLPPTQNPARIGVGTDFQSFAEWAESVAEISLHDTLDGGRITIAFLDGEELPRAEAIEGQPYLEVDFKNWLTDGTVLQFDLYLHLPANDKHILYLKKETNVTADTVGRFERLNTPKIFIDPADMNGFVSYCIQVKIKRDLTR